MLFGYVLNCYILVHVDVCRMNYFCDLIIRNLLTFIGLTALLGNLGAQVLTVPSGETFFIASGTVVTSTSGATTINNGGTFTVNGEFQTVGDMTVNGTINATSGTLTYNGSSAQSVSLNGATVKNVTIGSAASVTLTSGVNIQGGSNRGILSVVGGGTLATGGFLTLKSDANGSGVVSQGASTGAYITGNVNVERFIPATRAYRLLSPSVTTSTSIRANWQENGGTTTGLGTHITGNGGAVNGFDPTGTNNPSLFTYNVSSATGTWMVVDNTNSNTLTAGAPMRIIVRGDRNTDLTDNAAASSNTTLRATGTVGQGDFIISGLNTNANGFTFIGNPFPCPVDMSPVMTDATNVNTSTYIVWDPNLGTRGAYASISTSSLTANASGSNQNRLLQPGQAFFIQNASSGTPSFRINEAHKSGASTQTDVFRQIPPFSTLHLTLYQTDSFENKGRALDGLEINFDGEMNTDFDDRDFRKMINPDENLSVFVSDQFCSVDSRNLPESNEIVDLRISQMRHSRYTLRATFFSDLGIPAYLLDRHTDQYHALNAEGVTRIDFDNDKSATATANQRFALVFEKTNNVHSTKVPKLVLFPNPLGSNHVLNASAVVESWSLYDLSGKQIAENSHNNDTQIQLPKNLSAGTYTIQLHQLGQTSSQLISLQ